MCNSCAAKKRLKEAKVHPTKGRARSEETKKKISEANKGKSSPNSGFRKGHIIWKGKHHTQSTKIKMSFAQGGTGIPYENAEYGADFDNALKEQIRFRDNYTCQICGCSQLENGRQLDCHHIDYNRKNNKWSNLIALCMKCHTKIRFNRDYWKKLIKKGDL